MQKAVNKRSGERWYRSLSAERRNLLKILFFGCSLITLSTFALFAGAAMAAEDAHRVISEGTYSYSQYATQTDVASGGSSLTINGGTFNLSSTETAQKNLYGGGKAGSTIVGDTSFIFNGGDIVNISGWTHSFYGASAENSLVKGNSTV